MSKKNNIKIVYYSENYEKAHYEFATRNYGNRRKRRNKDYLYWKFRGNYNEELKTLILAYDQVLNKVVGQIGLIPFSIEVGNKIYKAVWRCDVMMDKNYRGLGIAQMMYAKSHQDYKLLFNCGSSISAKKAILKMGYKPIRRSLSLTMPVKYSFFNQRLNFSRPKLSKVKNLLFLINSFFFKAESFSKIPVTEYLKNNLSLIKGNEGLIRSHKDDSFVSWRFSEFKDYYGGIDCFKSQSGIKFSGYFTKSKIFFVTEVCSLKFRDTVSVLKYVYEKYKNEGLKEIQFTYHYKNKLPNFFMLGCFAFNFNPQSMFYTEDKKLESSIMKKELLFNNYDCDKNL